MDNILAQPYYGDNKIRFYNTTAPVAASPFYTLDISNEINSVWPPNGKSIGPNSVIVYNRKMFVAIADEDGVRGGVLIFNYSDIYPARNSNAPIILKFNITNGLSCGGLAINPVNGDLYVPTFHVFGDNGGIYTYTAASNYAPGSLAHFSTFNDESVAEICANLAFDGKGNLWMTTWSPSNQPQQHFLICYKGLDKDDFYKITNTPTKSYTAKNTAGATINVHLLSAPEGITFDVSGNLYIANNNDFALCNNPGEGTIVKVLEFWISTIVNFKQSTGKDPLKPVFSPPPLVAKIQHIPGSKPGGLIFEGNNLYINDQGQNQGSDFQTNGTIWTWDVTTAFNTANLKTSGIHTTYPGNGTPALIQKLYIQDNVLDTGAEPNLTTTRPWESVDIWVTKAATTTGFSNPHVSEVINGGEAAKVYVMVRNNGLTASAGGEVLKLYWAKAGVGLDWPKPWTGTADDTSTGVTIKMGREIVSSQALPVVQPAGNTILMFNWPDPPNPEDYKALLLDDDHGHFCLLARIETSSTAPFGMTAPEKQNSYALLNNVLSNNKIAWKNIHINNITPGKIAAGIIAANYTTLNKNVQLTFELLNANGAQMALGSDKLVITAKGRALEKLNETRFSQHAIEKLGNGQFAVLDLTAGMENISLQPGEILPLRVEYRPEKEPIGCVLRVMQYEQHDETTTLIGGQTFVFGEVKGFTTPPKKCPKSSFWLWILLTMIVLCFTSILKPKRKKRK